MAAGRLDRRALTGRVLRLAPDRLRGTHGRVRRWGGSLRPLYWLALPMVVAGVVAYALGCAVELAARWRDLG